MRRAARAGVCRKCLKLTKIVWRTHTVFGNCPKPEWCLTSPLCGYIVEDAVKSGLAQRTINSLWQVWLDKIRVGGCDGAQSDIQQDGLLPSVMARYRHETIDSEKIRAKARPVLIAKETLHMTVMFPPDNSQGLGVNVGSQKHRRSADLLIKYGGNTRKIRSPNM